MSTFLITGGTGFVGKELTDLLLKKGHQVFIYSRSPQENSDSVFYYYWDPQKGKIDPKPLESANYIIHLAGANVAGKRWTKSYKKHLLESRTQSANLLKQTLKNLDNHKIKALISASGINYYGSNRSEILNEESGRGDDFLADVCKDWEATAVDLAETNGLRYCIIRIGMVLGKEGALKEIEKPVKLMAGAPLGSGKQVVSWIHVKDLARLILFCSERHEVKGVFNGVAPHKTTNVEMTKKLGKVLKKPVFLPPVPEFVLRIILGEMVTVVTGSLHVSSEKTESTGFKFEYPNLDAAYKEIYS